MLQPFNLKIDKKLPDRRGINVKWPQNEKPPYLHFCFRIFAGLAEDKMVDEVVDQLFQVAGSVLAIDDGNASVFLIIGLCS